MPLRRLLAVAGLAAAAAALAIAPAGVAHADPPAPTDYRSEVVSIEPAVPGIHASIVGGDAFFELRVDPGVTVEVVVLGYSGEPFARYLPGGEVQENEASPSVALNGSRYGSSSAGAPAADATPRWHTVAHGGSWVWHDHRTHWMDRARPAGRHPGDVVVQGVVPLLVGDQEVQVTVTSTWMPAPSGVPGIVGALLGGLAGLAIAACVVPRGAPQRWRLAAAGLLAVGALAAVVGVWQDRSLPAATGPPVSAWAFPLTACAVAVVALVRRWSAFVAAGFVLFAAVELALWAFGRRDVLDHAILPTSAPWWLDRAVTAGTLVAAGAAVAAALLVLVRWLSPTPAVAAARPRPSR